jgi:hypothetical protein
MVNGWLPWVRSIDKAILTVRGARREFGKGYFRLEKYSHQWHVLYIMIVF